MGKTADSMKVETGLLDTKLVWEQKDVWIDRQNHSLAEWNKVDPDKREAIMRIVGYSLEKVLEELETWIPSSLVMDSMGQYMDCTFRINFSSIDDEVKAFRETTKKQILDAAKSTWVMIEEAESDGSDPG